MDKDVNLKRIYIQLGIAVVIISFSSILIKLTTAPPMIIAFYRMLFSCLILTPYFLFEYRDRLKDFLNYRYAVVGFFLAMHFFFWITSFEYTDVANSVIFVTLQPLFTLLLEAIFAREDLRKGVVTGVIMALIGGLIVSIGDLHDIFSKVWGDLLALSAAFFMALYLFIGRSLREEIEYFPYIYIVYTYAAIILGVLVAIRGLPPGGYGGINYLYILAMALGPMIIGHSTLNYCVRFVPTTIVSVSVLGEPVLTTIYAWIILGERITPVVAVGGAFIITGIYRTMAPGRNKEKPLAGRLSKD